MKIPIDYNPAKRGEIKELLLYVSPDQGQTWQHAGRRRTRTGTPSSRSTPRPTGVYWFNMVVVDKNGRREPADVFKAAPALKVLFDTKKPVVNIASAQRAGDDVTVAWKVTEQNPDWSKFKLEYSLNGGDLGPGPDAAGSRRVGPVQGGRRREPDRPRRLADLAGHTAEATSPVAGTTPSPPSRADPIVPTGGSELRGRPGDPPVAGRRPRCPVPRAGPGRCRCRRCRRSSGPRTPAARTSRAGPTPRRPRSASRRPRARRADRRHVEPGLVHQPAARRPDGPKAEPVGVSTPVPAAHLPAPQVINVTSFKLAYEVEDQGCVRRRQGRGVGDPRRGPDLESVADDRQAGVDRWSSTWPSQGDQGRSRESTGSRWSCRAGPG